MDQAFVIGRCSNQSKRRGWWTKLGGLLSSALLVGIALGVVRPAAGQALVPPSFELSETARAAMNEAWLTDEEERRLRVFHGAWEDADVRTPADRAFVALNAWRLDDEVFSDPALPAVTVAEARLRAGELDAVHELLQDDGSVRSMQLRAEAFVAAGRYVEARELLGDLAKRMLDDPRESAVTITDGVRGLILRADLEPHAARDYQAMMTMLGAAHQEIDRLYWPARLTEAALLLSKHNRIEGITALHETLGLNPRSEEAWYLLGRTAIASFDFDGAIRAEAALRRLNATHPRADLLAIELRLVNNDPEGAIELLDPLLARWPKMRSPRAFAVAAHVLTYDDEAAATALAAYEALSPGAAEAYSMAGHYLSIFRQYDMAAKMLEEAARRKPGWPVPVLELALMEMQTGRDEKAHRVLREVTALDPFDKRAANGLHLLEQLAEYERIETEHFIIRYQKGIDEVLVDLMPEELEKIHATVSSRFGWEPSQKTIIEVQPNHQRFAVRITGMPHIHTIAACTGPVIAMEVPREGKKSDHKGPFDWRRVIQHEYTHTITLDQTNNRIPHWLTEAAAVSMELAPRDYDRCQMLASSWRDGTLFDLDEISWAFVRPRKPGDRSKAYAQGHWMVEFMNERFGDSALVKLLARYFEGEREADAIPNALGVSREEFYDAFIAWAEVQVRGWGMAPEPSYETLIDELLEADPVLAELMAASRQARLEGIVKHMAERIGTPSRRNEPPFEAESWPGLIRPPVEITDATLQAWRERFPDHPEILRALIEREIDSAGGVTAAHVPLLERYAGLRPVDLFPHRKLAQLYLDGDEPTLAIPHLEEIDLREEKSPVYAWRLASLHREAGRLPLALEKITRAVTINPYQAQTRELAAAIAIQAGQLELARKHIKALTLIEPDRPQHTARLERLDALIAQRRGEG